MFLLLSPHRVCADVASELSSMIGFRIIAASSVTKVSEVDGDKYVHLANHVTLKVPLLLLDPLEFSDVVIFAKPPSRQVIEKYGKVLPLATLTEIKVLIDDEIYDAESAGRR